jgi:hypothetical protein
LGHVDTDMMDCSASKDPEDFGRKLRVSGKRSAPQGDETGVKGQSMVIAGPGPFTSVAPGREERPR